MSRWVLILHGISIANTMATKISQSNQNIPVMLCPFNMVEAYNLAGEIWTREQEVGRELKSIWEKSRFKKCQSVDGREFVHVLDDLKDHFADRRTGLEHMLAPFERMEIEKWQNVLMDEIDKFAETHNVVITGLREEPLNE